MYQQMDIFDFIEKPPDSEGEPSRSQFEQLFEKVYMPVCVCTNCLCNYCANNAENLWRTVKPEEMRKSCFNCDECRIYDGNCRSKNLRKEECIDFMVSNRGYEYMAYQNRKKIRLLED